MVAPGGLLHVGLVPATKLEYVRILTTVTLSYASFIPVTTLNNKSVVTCTTLQNCSFISGTSLNYSSRAPSHCQCRCTQCKHNHKCYYEKLPHSYFLLFGLFLSFLGRFHH